MNLIKLVPDFLKESFKLVDKFVVDKDKALELKSELEERADRYQIKILESQRDIIISEAQSGSFITRNWRPLVMVNFAALITAHWLGYTPENLGEAEVIALLAIVKVGLGGYVVGRSGEKIAKAWKDK